MLLYFILGIIFVTIVLPIIDNLVSIITSYTEYITYIIAAKVYHIQKELGEKDDQSEQDSHNTIGFSTDVVGYDIEEQEIEQDEDDEEQ